MNITDAQAALLRFMADKRDEFVPFEAMPPVGLAGVTPNIQNWRDVDPLVSKGLLEAKREENKALYRITPAGVAVAEAPASLSLPHLA